MAKFDNDDKDYIDMDEEVRDETEEDEDRGDSLEDDEEEDVEEDDDSSDDEEDEEGSDEDKEDDEEEDQSTTKKNIRIPKYRLDQEIQKNRELKEREKWLEGQLEKLINSKPGLEKEVQEAEEVSNFDFEAAEEQYITLLLEGETKQAVQLRKQIDGERQKAFQKTLEIVRNQAVDEASKKSEFAKDEEKFKQYISNYENKYPFLNPNKKAYNEEAVDTINTLMAGFLAKGLVRSEALKSAVEKVLPMYAPAEKSEKDERVIKQRKKNVIANKRQPPATKGKSFKDTNIDEFDVEGLDEKEFAKLAKDRRALAKLRGDIV